MELKVTNEVQNPLVKRKEVEATINNKVSPNKFEVAKLFAEKYSVPVDNVRVMTIYGKYGTQDFDVKANVYESKEERDKVELFSKKEKEAEDKALEAEAAPAEEEKPAEEAPATEAAPTENAEAPAEEKPVEEAPKEEAPAEEKAEEKSE